MATNMLVVFESEIGPVKGKIENLVCGTHAAIRVTGRNQRRYRNRMLLLVPLSNLVAR